MLVLLNIIVSQMSNVCLLISNIIQQGVKEVILSKVV